MLAGQEASTGERRNWVHSKIENITYSRYVSDTADRN